MTDETPNIAVVFEDGYVIEALVPEDQLVAATNLFFSSPTCRSAYIEYQGTTYILWAEGEGKYKRVVARNKNKSSGCFAEGLQGIREALP